MDTGIHNINYKGFIVFNEERICYSDDSNLCNTSNFNAVYL